MATKLFLDKSQGAAFFKRTGCIIPGEIMTGIKAFEANPLSKEIKKNLTDTSSADYSNIKTCEIEAYASYWRHRLKDLQFAVYAPDDLTFGLARMFGIVSDMDRFMAFRTMEEAVVWLDVKLPSGFRN